MRSLFLWIATDNPDNSDSYFTPPPLFPIPIYRYLPALNIPI